MQVEAKKRFSHGFILNEADLRRIIDIVIEQYGKLPEAPKPTVAFQVKYKNGAIADTTSIDEVLAQENFGSSQIIRLSINFETNYENEKVKVEIEFINADIDEEPGYTSIWFSILGNSRDWVFISCTLLEERITKIKRFAFNQLGSKKGSAVFYRMLAFVLFMMGMMGGLLYPAFKSQPKLSDALIAAKKQGQLSDPIDALIMIKKFEENITRDMPYQAAYPIGILFVIVISLFIVLYFLYKYYLVYNFCWGDYTEYFQKKESARKFVFVVIITGIVISVVGSILANKIGF